MKLLLPLLFLFASGGLFWGFIDPTYADINELKKEEKLYIDALENSKKLQEMRDKLLDQYNSFSTTDLERLEKMLPSHMDNVRLIRDIDGIANRYGMSLRDARVDSGNSGSDKIDIDTGKYRSVIVNFTVTTPYKTFLRFLDDLERSLRIVDVVNIEFSSSEKDLYEYRVSVKTYWLK